MKDQAASRACCRSVAIGKVALTLLGLACGASIGREGPTVQIGAAIMHALGGCSACRGRNCNAHWCWPAARRVSPPLSTHRWPASCSPSRSSAIPSRHAPPARCSPRCRRRRHGARIDGQLHLFRPHRGGAPVRRGLDRRAALQRGRWPRRWVFSQALVVAAYGVPGLAGGLSCAIPWFLPRPVGWASRPSASSAADRPMAPATPGTRRRGGHSHLPAYYAALKLAASVSPMSVASPAASSHRRCRWAPVLGLAGAVRAGAPAGAVILLGMVAYFSGVVQAPITASVIVMEMTDNQACHCFADGDCVSGIRRIPPDLPTAAV